MDSGGMPLTFPGPKMRQATLSMSWTCRLISSSPLLSSMLCMMMNAFYALTNYLNENTKARFMSFDAF